ncbi:MAG: hypothetical protein DRR08_25495 [Candidatus Parabeggiatoa sp. nov. 2]|nr:MAG: hypothetical protein DRR08_25495 [Gammaproteobacteria bacterium]
MKRAKSGVQDLSWTSILSFSKIGFIAVGKYTLIESTEKYLMVTVLTKSLEPIPQQWTHKDNFNLLDDQVFSCAQTPKDCYNK